LQHLPDLDQHQLLLAHHPENAWGRRATEPGPSGCRRTP
jgi:hypothetical protein